MTELMTVEEVAEYLRISTRTIYRLLKEERIPAKKAASQWRFDKASIDKWMDDKSVGKKVNILIIDDEKYIRMLFRVILEELGHNVVTAKDSIEGLEQVQKHNFDIVFIDLKMPGMDGAELIREIKKIRPELPTVIVTGYPESELMTRALAQGPLGIMNKPVSQSDIITSINSFLRIIK